MLRGFRFQASDFCSFAKSLALRHSHSQTGSVAHQQPYTTMLQREDILEMSLLC